MPDGYGFDAFKRHIASASTIEVVLKSHLMIEDQLVETLKEILPDPDKIEFKWMGFKGKVQLCAGLGYLSDFEFAGLLSFNALRNKFSHEFDYELTVVDVQKIVNSLDPELRKEKKLVPAKGQDPLDYLRDVVTVLYLQVSVLPSSFMSKKDGAIQKQIKKRTIMEIVKDISGSATGKDILSTTRAIQELLM